MRLQRAFHLCLPGTGKRGRPPVIERVLVCDLSGKNPLPRLLLSAKLTLRSTSHSLSVLINSGAEQNFIDVSLVSKFSISTRPLPHPLRVFALSGHRLPDITHITLPVTLTLSGNHVENICLCVFKAPVTPLVVGYPWLSQHNPHIDWKKEQIMGWSTDCHMNYLRAATPSVPSPLPGKPSKAPELSSVPPVYHDLAAVSNCFQFQISALQNSVSISSLHNAHASLHNKVDILQVNVSCYCYCILILILLL